MKKSKSTESDTNMDSKLYLKEKVINSNGEDSDIITKKQAKLPAKLSKKTKSLKIKNSQLFETKLNDTKACPTIFSKFSEKNPLPSHLSDRLGKRKVMTQNLKSVTTRNSFFKNSTQKISQKMENLKQQKQYQ